MIVILQNHFKVTILSMKFEVRKQWSATMPSEKGTVYNAFSNDWCNISRIECETNENENEHLIP